MGFRCLALIVALLLGGPAWAQSAGLALSETSAYFTYGTLVGGQSFGQNEARFGLLYNTANTFLVQAGLQVRDEAGTRVPGLEAGVGGHLTVAVRDEREVLAFAVGGLVRYRLPQAERFAVAGEGFYAPDIVSFLDAKAYWTWALQVEYEILPQASVHLGYRRFEARTRGGTRFGLDKGLRVGVEVQF